MPPKDQSSSNKNNGKTFESQKQKNISHGTFGHQPTTDNLGAPPTTGSNNSDSSK